MSTETNKLMVRRFFEEAYNQRNLTVVEEMIAPHFVNHSAGVAGPEGIRQAVSADIAAHPDLHVTLDDVIAEGDKVAVRGTESFTRHPDGEQVTLSWMEFIRFEDGMAVEAWAQADLSYLEPK